MLKIKELLRCSTIPSEIEANLQEVIKLLTEQENVVVDIEVVSLVLLLLRNSGVSRSLALNVIAYLARNESNREILCSEELFKQVITLIPSDNPEESLQALRCVCNICAENEKAKELFSNSDGVKILLGKSKKVLLCNDDNWNQIISPACTCIQNIIDESESIKEEFLKENTLEILGKFLTKYYKDITIATAVVGGISALADSESGHDHPSLQSVLLCIVDTLSYGSNEYIEMLFGNLLTEYGNQEKTRVLLCKTGYMKVLQDLVTKRPNFHESECKDPVLKLMTDLIVMLTSGEESFDLLLKEEKDILGRFSRWIESPNRHVQVSAGLALGNYARSDETCAALVNSKIHENMINVIKENIEDEKFCDRFEAYTSCLRNLAIPATNKTQLIEAGLPDVAVKLTKSSTMPVQFKSLAILRLLVQGNETLASQLLVDRDLIDKICELSETSFITSVPSEAQRLAAALAKYSNDEDAMRAGLSRGCVKPIVKLLSSDFLSMKNEGLIGLIMILANVNDCLDKITETDCMSKLIKILQDESAQAQTLFNALTFLQALASVDGGKTQIEEEKIAAMLQGLSNHSEDIIRNKVTETLELLIG